MYICMWVFCAHARKCFLRILVNIWCCTYLYTMHAFKNIISDTHYIQNIYISCFSKMLRQCAGYLSYSKPQILVGKYVLIYE